MAANGHALTWKNKIKYLFNSPVNIIVTLLVMYVLVRLVVWIVDWGIVNATWSGTTKQICFDNGGACWIFIKEKILFFIYGFIPKTTYWRINILFVLFFGMIGLLFTKWVKNKVMLFGTYLLLFPFFTYVLASGAFGLSKISLNLWGGFMLTLIFSIMGLIFAFPLGLLLALGRRSKLPIIKSFSVGYIEFFRGVPLITILFMASIVLPLFFPVGVEINKTIRVILGLVIFQSAYFAEIVRGGLQTIDKGQYESADSLGLPYMYKMYFVILPQALRATVINLGDISIAFVKDTTLVFVIGLFDMLGMYMPTTGDPLWLGTEPEALVFSGLLYWILCYIIATLVRVADRRMNKDRRGVTL